MRNPDKHEFNPDDPIDPTAARVLYAKEDMLASQYRVLQYIVLRSYEIAERECFFERTRGGGPATIQGLNDPNNDQPSPYEEHQNTRRPSQVFFIDGARGAGKTSLLITLRWLLARLGAGSSRPKTAADNPDQLLNRIVQDLRHRVTGKNEGNSPRGGSIDLSTLHVDKLNFLTQHVGANSVPRRTAICLSIIHPADLEDRQPILEGIFAQMSCVLDGRIAKAKKSSSKGTESTTHVLEELKTEITKKVAKGWHLSRQAGVDAILRDSVDYNDYLEQMGAANQESHSRVVTWRRYVNKFLDSMDAELLVILLDDADNRPEVTLDIFHTARIFLDHPRIITVLAGNLRSMRQSLMTEELARLSTAMESLRRAPEATEQVCDVLPAATPRNSSKRSCRGRTVSSSTSSHRHATQSRLNPPPKARSQRATSACLSL